MADYTSELDAVILALQEKLSSVEENLASLGETDAGQAVVIESVSAESAALATRVSALEGAVPAEDPRVAELQKLFGMLSEAATTTGKSVSALSQVVSDLDARLKKIESPRSSLVPGTYKPGPGTTGHVGTLTPTVGGITTTQAGQVFQNLLINGPVVIKHPGVQFINCHIKAGLSPASDPSYAAIKCYDALTSPAKIIDCTIESVPTSNLSSCGVQGRDVEVIRCNIFGSIDGVMSTNYNVRIISCWIHDLPKHPVVATHKDGSHNDGVQAQGGNNVEIIGNYIVLGYKNNAGVMATQDVTKVNGLVIDRNWFSSIEPTKENQTPVAINITQTAKGAMAGVKVTNNVFSLPATWRLDRAALIDSGTYDAMVAAGTLVGNVYEDGTPARITRNSVAA